MAKVQLSELVSKVPTQCLHSAFPELKELQSLCPQQTQATQPTDCSMDSCLTSCEGSQRDQEIHNCGMRLIPYTGSSTPLEAKDVAEHPGLQHSVLKWCDDAKENRKFTSSMRRDAERRTIAAERSNSDLSMCIGLQGEKGNGSNGYSEGRFKGRDGVDSFLDGNKHGADSVHSIKKENEKMSHGYRIPCFGAKLDLNAHDEDDITLSCKQFDLNGFSWS